MYKRQIPHCSIRMPWQWAPAPRPPPPPGKPAKFAKDAAEKPPPTPPPKVKAEKARAILEKAARKEKEAADEG